MNDFVIVNGEVLKKDTPVFYHDNRGFRFGDAVFETMHANGTEVQFFNEHINRLKRVLDIFKIDIPESLDEKMLYVQIKSLLVRNKLFQGAKIRLSYFRSNGGTYLPLTNKAEYIIETEKLDSHLYKMNAKGWRVDVFNEYKKDFNLFGQYKNANSLLYVLASIQKQEKSFDDMIILNTDNNIVEGTNSNIFIVKKNSIYTPSIDEGCVQGIMRNNIIDIALSLNYTVFDDCIIVQKDLIEADEMFFTNAVQGIRWVIAYKNRRFFNKTSKKILQKLNELAFS